MFVLPPAGTPGRHALYLLGVCIAMTLVARGTMETYAIFLLPLSEAFGWDRTLVSGVYSVAYVVLGTAGPVVGFLFDRWGPVRLYALGLAALLSAFAIASVADQLWQFYLSLGLLLGIGVAAVGAVPTAALVNRWFRDRLNSAMADAYASGSLGMMVFAPSVQGAIDAFGWRGAYVGLLVPLAALLALVLVVRLLRGSDGHPDYRRRTPRTGADGAAAAELGVREAFRMPAFYGLIFSFAWTGIGMYTVLLQTPAFLIELGFTASQAANAFGAIGLLAPAGMIGFGWVGDRIGRRVAVLISYGLTLSGICMLILLSLDPRPLWLILFVVLFGSSFGSRGPAISSIAARIFQGPSFGRIYGFVTVGMGLGGGLGAFSGGFWHDVSGGYLVGHCFALGAIACGAAPFLFVRAMARA